MVSAHKVQKRHCPNLFTVDGKRIVLLHGFIKKSQQTPENELQTARRRLKNYQEAP